MPRTPKETSLEPSQSRTNSHLELEREERRADEERLAYLQSDRSHVIWGAYEDGLVTDDELDLATDIYSARWRTKGYPAILARSNARKAKYQCSVCGDPVYAKGRCRSCYVFLRKHKRDRTLEEIAENTYGRVARRGH